MNRRTEKAKGVVVSRVEPAPCLGRLLVIAAVAFLSLNTPAQETRRPRAMAGLKAVEVQVIEPPPQAAQCGITQQSITAAAKSSLQKTGLKLGDDSLTYVLYKPFAMRVMDGTCLLSLQLSVHTPGRLKAEFGETSGVYILWADSWLSMTKVSDAPKAVERGMEKMATSLGNDWAEQNKR